MLINDTQFEKSEEARAAYLELLRDGSRAAMIEARAINGRADQDLSELRGVRECLHQVNSEESVHADKRYKAARVRLTNAQEKYKAAEKELEAARQECGDLAGMPQREHQIKYLCDRLGLVSVNVRRAIWPELKAAKLEHLVPENSI